MRYDITIEKWVHIELGLPFVLVEIVLAREHLLAEFTVEHLLAGVRNDVSHQMLFAAERFVATGLGAAERTQTQVQFHVLIQVLLALEHLVADATGWQLFGIVRGTSGW